MSINTIASELSEPARQLLLVSLLARDRIISNNGKSFLKELVLRRDKRMGNILKLFESKPTGNSDFMEEIHDLILEESRSFYDDMFQDTSLEVGKTLSKEDRENQNLNSEKSLIYGEVDYNSFYRVLRKIKPLPGSTFYDLGSGTSKAVFVARFTQDFGRCTGVEILPSLHLQASKITSRYNAEYKQLLSLGYEQEADVYMGSFLDHDWSDGDVVFANSTCFDDELMAAMSVQAEKLRPGSFFVTFTKGLTSKCFEVLERKRYRMSWGPATVFIHRRLLPNGSSVGLFRLNTLPSDNIEYEDESSKIDRQGFVLTPDEEADDDDDEELEDEGSYDDDGSEEQESDGDDEDDDHDDDIDEEDEDEEDDGGYGDIASFDSESKRDEANFLERQRRQEDWEEYMQAKLELKERQEKSRLPNQVPSSEKSSAWRPPQPPTNSTTYTLRPTGLPTPPNVQVSSQGAAAEFQRRMATNRGMDSPQDSMLLMRKQLRK